MKAANDNVPRTSVEIADTVAMKIREHTTGRLVDILIWMLEQTCSLTIPVALTLYGCAPSIGIAFAEECTDSVECLIDKNRTVRLNHLLARLGSSFRFSTINGYGYRQSLGDYIYFKDGEDEYPPDFPRTIWLSRKLYGRNPLTEKEEETLQILEFPGWRDLEDKLRSVGFR